MNEKNDLFSLLGGIFLMCAGALMFIATATNMLRSLRSAVSPGNIIALNIDLLFILCGLFLLLRKRLPAAIVMCAVAALFLGNVAFHLIRGEDYNWLMLGCVFLAYAIFTAGLFGRGLYAMTMCGAAALLRLVPFTSQLTGVKSTLRTGNALLIVNSVSSLLGAALLIAGMVMAGLWLFGPGTEEPSRSRYSY